MNYDDTDVYRTDNAIKNHWNSTMRRKFELEEEMRSGLQTSDSAGVCFSVPVVAAYTDPLPSPGFAKPDQVPTGYWSRVPSHDLPPNVTGQKSSPDTALPDFSEWLSPGTYQPSVTHAVAYPSFNLTMSSGVTFHYSSHSASPLYSLVPKEPTSLPNLLSPMTTDGIAQETPMMVPHQMAHGHPSGIDRSHPPPQQQKQASPLLLQQQQVYSHSSAGSTSLQSTGETTLLTQQMIIDYHRRNSDGLVARVCSFISSLHFFIVRG